ncbi:elongator complex protein 3 [Heliophilum fasciatum]|uniref:Radical SAM family protein n=1 Tax=Heliophilum fasciatum TaxID=35700 RepID=A0A4R2RLB9_9FIRM|nr:radical SAM protein [Heliophilum fasciatum]MCW2278423.1 histone acetyltransferase (RNA polymerase elongator complex component) [Heliophilum fasciatum]TCP63678.1 radical SAM family protein [Heliophilum fasciatum]
MIIPIFLPQQGCPGHCVFCNQVELTGQAGCVDEMLVETTVQAYLSTAKTRHNERPWAEAIAFYGGSFTLLPAATQDRLLAAAGRWVRQGSVGALRLSTRPDGIDQSTVERLVTAGVSTVEIGTQSMRDDVLQASGRCHSAKDTERAATLLQQAGFAVGIHLMTGLPGDDEEGCLFSLQRILELRPDFLRIHPTLVLAGAPLAEQWRQGSYQPWTWGRTLRLLAVMAERCAAAKVPVIRWGLMPGERCQGATLAGPVRPDLGEWVRRMVGLNYALTGASRWAKELAGADGPVLLVPEEDLSLVTGHGRWLLRHWQAATGLSLEVQAEGRRLKSSISTERPLWQPLVGPWKFFIDEKKILSFDKEELIGNERI